MFLEEHTVKEWLKAKMNTCFMFVMAIFQVFFAALLAYTFFCTNHWVF